MPRRSIDGALSCNGVSLGPARARITEIRSTIQDLVDELVPKIGVVGDSLRALASVRQRNKADAEPFLSQLRIFADIVSASGTDTEELTVGDWVQLRRRIARVFSRHCTAYGTTSPRFVGTVLFADGRAPVFQGNVAFTQLRKIDPLELS